MGTPQQGYPPYEQPGQEQYQQDQYGAGQQPGYDGQRSPTQDGQPAPAAGGKKKRAYAGQAYDFGGGANSALGGQQPAGGAYPAPPAYNAYPQQNAQQAYQHPPYGIDQPPAQVPAYGQPPAQAPGYGQPPGVGGYQSPDPGYPAQGAVAPLSPIGGITQGMGNLGVGGHPQQHPAPNPQRPQLNQLYPTDLLNQALNVTELDLPPPPIILPPNVRDTPIPYLHIVSNTV